MKKRGYIIVDKTYCVIVGVVDLARLAEERDRLHCLAAELGARGVQLDLPNGVSVPVACPFDHPRHKA